MSLGARVQLRQHRPAARPGRPRVRVHRHLAHAAEVHGQAVVAHRGAAEVVRAAAHRDLQPGILREPDRRSHVAGPAQRAITAGCASIAPFQTERAWS